MKKRPRRPSGSISEDKTGSRPENVESVRHRIGRKVWPVDTPPQPPPADAYLSDKSYRAAGQLKVNFKRACSVPPPATAATAPPPSPSPSLPPPSPSPPRCLPTNNVNDVDNVPAPSWRRQPKDSISSMELLRIPTNGLAWKLQLQLELELELRLELLRLTPSSTWSRGSLLSATLRS
ncbi:hypothetical protein CLIM01_12810 [Colletotrichum limetticola]|uniref:Uncharacterized protein n=1 Tax=Colletotrichum limetticola TaxID=1209924 RepID=A0ABQ9PCN3_9PEZI|nr:hypothetical protein CLIM01_12810 [Colletotrichum limetticola]